MGILRDLFGPSREEIWRQLSAEIGADYVAGGFWKGDKEAGQDAPGLPEAVAAKPKSKFNYLGGAGRSPHVPCEVQGADWLVDVSDDGCIDVIGQSRPLR